MQPELLEHGSESRFRAKAGETGIRIEQEYACVFAFKGAVKPFESPVGLSHPGAGFRPGDRILQLDSSHEAMKFPYRFVGLAGEDGVING